MTHSIYNGMGYFRNDDRASGGKLVEDDLLGCGHSGLKAQMQGCVPTMKRSEWKNVGGMCYVCNAPLCPACTSRALRFGCDGPEVGRIEDLVNDMYRRQQNAKILGI
jgi:hypothetical protein